MNSHKTVPTSVGFGIQDALYIIFKHKLKIILISLIGFSVSAIMAYKVLKEPSFQSSAKLMVRYVVERSTIDPEAAGQMMNGGMPTELEILNSRDTAIIVAEAVGPANLLPDSITLPTATDAATRILNNLEVESPMGSPNMLYLKYRDSNPHLAVEVLTQIILTYFSKHLEFHRNTDAFSQVSKQTDEARSKLRLTEEEINQLKNRSGVLTIQATMKEFESRRRSIRESQLEAESELAEQVAKVESLKKDSSADQLITKDQKIEKPHRETLDQHTNQTLNQPQKNATIALAISEFNNLSQRLSILEQKRNNLLVNRKVADPMIASLAHQIDGIHKDRTNLIERYPEFTGIKDQTGISVGQTHPRLNLSEEIAMESASKAKLDSIHNQAKMLEAEVTKISALGFQLQDLERRRNLEEEKYRFFQTSLEKARLDETLDPRKIPNISVIQSPSPPLKAIDDNALKLIIGTAFAGIVGALAIAILIEKVIDRRITRPTDIVNRLQIPLMLSIPHSRAKPIKKLPKQEEPKEPLGLTCHVDPTNHHKHIQLISNTDHFIRPFTAAIHDRLVFDFQINQTTHKPKLIALTGLSKGAGTSTIAAGLSKTLTDNQGHKVLLVDLSENSTGITQRNSESLLEAIEESQPGNFDYLKNGLYFASASTRMSSSAVQVFAAADLHRLLPKLMASKFDYIVFDMPPINPTSTTLTMARLMDKVLLILDGSNTSKEELCWAYTALENTKADVSCIFNKARSHAPRWVQGDG